MATTVILGSGIIGLSTAYYLAEHQPGSSIHLVDASTELFSSASGFAGGFVAKDWFQPAVASLGALSFREHQKLAEREEGRENWGYSRTVTVSYEPGSGRLDRVDSKQDGEIPPWLRRSESDAVSVMDDGSGTAIV